MDWKSMNQSVTSTRLEVTRTKTTDFINNKAIEEVASTPIRSPRFQTVSSKPYADFNPTSLNLEVLQNNLGNCLSIIDEEVMKGYVTKLDELPIISPQRNLDKKLNPIHFFKVTELVYQEDEFSVDNLSMVFHALSNRPCTISLMLKSDGEKTDFYLGARPNGDNSAGTLFQMLKQSLLGFFPGSRLADYYDEDMKADMQSLNPGCISTVTCVADYKHDSENITNKDFIQGLEKYVYAMQRKPYTALFIADSVDHNQLMMRKRDYENIYTQISPFANMQLNFSVSDGGSTSTGNSQGTTWNKSYTSTTGASQSQTETDTYTTGSSYTTGNIDSTTYTTTESTADGKTHTTGITDGTSRTVTDTESTTNTVSANVGISAGLAGPNASVGASTSKTHSTSVANGVSHTESVSDSVSKTLTHGFSDSTGRSTSTTNGTTESKSKSVGTGKTTSQSDANTVGEAFNLVNTKTMTDTFGKSQGVALNAKNMTLNLTLERIEKHLRRIEECESFGMWNFAAYFIGETASEIETAANTYKSVVAGADSGIERSAINSWTDKESVDDLFEYISNFVHPQFKYNRFSYDGDNYISVDPSALVSTNELAIHMGLPRHSVRGLAVTEHAPFAQEVITKQLHDNKTVHLGAVYNLGQQTNTAVDLDIESLSMHTFITGSTGSGKSNTVYHMLSELRKQNIPFLVVEPAKGEYKQVFKDVRCFGTNPKLGEVLKINPFSFPEEVHVLEHIDRIVEIFNVCWPMYAAMPAVLKESIEQAYISAGWNLDLSENTKVPDLFPTFDDVLRELNTTISKSEYSSDTKGDYIGSLSTRLKSLTNGINGRIFVSDEQNLDELFDKSAIIDISRIGSMETKSLIMGLVVLKLQEYRMAKANGMNSKLKHVTVLEEAHNLLKKTSTEQSTDSANMVGKSVEMLTNAIAEIRTYGEGFIIVDQAPNLLDTAAIRNTNTKIVLRLPESIDRGITGGAMALKEQQFAELSKLPTGVAAVYQNDWQEAVLCTMPQHQIYDYIKIDDSNKSIIGDRKDYANYLLHLLLKKDLTEAEKQEAIELIKIANVAAQVRKDLILNIDKKNSFYEWAVADFINKNYEFRDIFRETTGLKSLEQFYRIVVENIKEEFRDFDKQELHKIIYYICRIEHEKYPDNKPIEDLRGYLKDRVM